MRKRSALYRRTRHMPYIHMLLSISSHIIVYRVRTGPILGFGPAGFLLTRTGAGPFFEPASLTYSVTNSKYEYCDARHA